jgi:hypothetical protein
MPTVTIMPNIAPHHESEARSGRVCPKMLTTFPHRPNVPSPKPGCLPTRARARKSPNTRASTSINNTRPGSKNGCRETNLDIVSKPADNRAQCRPSTFSQAISSALRGTISQPQSPDLVECHAPCIFPMDGFDTTEWRDSQSRTVVEFDAGI